MHGTREILTSLRTKFLHCWACTPNVLNINGRREDERAIFFVCVFFLPLCLVDGGGRIYIHDSLKMRGKKCRRGSLQAKHATFLTACSNKNAADTMERCNASLYLLILQVCTKPALNRRRDRWGIFARPGRVGDLGKTRPSFLVMIPPLASPPFKQTRKCVCVCAKRG